jgi:hypothetical protein
MDKNTLIRVVNRRSGVVGYKIPEMGIRRQFRPREPKDITFEELERLSYVPGGMRILKEYLVITNSDAVKELLPGVEPEYYYTEEDIKKLLLTGTLDEFLDCLDFAPDGVLELVKNLAVSLPLDNMSKREAIKNKLNFDVTRAIEIANTKYDGDSDAETEKEETHTRRAAAPKTETTSTRRATPPTYNVTSIKE